MPPPLPPPISGSRPWTPCAAENDKLLLLAEGSRAANFTAGFDYNFGFDFYGGIYNVYRNNNSATTFDALNSSEYPGATGTQQVVRYTTNHDVNGSDGTPVALFGGDAGAMSAFVVAALYKGVPMIYNGQEAGMRTAIPFPFTSVKVTGTPTAPSPAPTAAAGRPRRQPCPAPRHAHGLQHRQRVRLHQNGRLQQALVLANVRSTATTFAVPATLTGTWTNALDGTAVTLGASVSLPAYGYRVLRK